MIREFCEFVDDPRDLRTVEVAAGAVVGRSEHTVVRLDVRDAYPRGLALELALPEAERELVAAALA